MSATLEAIGTSVAAAIEPLFVKYLSPTQSDALGAAHLNSPQWLLDLEASIGGWDEGPRPNQAILLNRKGGYQLVPETAIMGAGGLLGAVEDPLNRVAPAFHLGDVAVGGVTGLVLGNVIDGLLPPRDNSGKVNFTNVAVKSGAIVGIGMWGHYLMGSGARLVAIGILGIQVLSDLVPLNKLVTWITDLFRKIMPATVPVRQDIPQYLPVSSPVGLNGVMGAEHRHDLYASIFG